jgi:hypothetical protein
LPADGVERARVEDVDDAVTHLFEVAEAGLLTACHPANVAARSIERDDVRRFGSGTQGHRTGSVR